jgi:hypothetical protein
MIPLILSLILSFSAPAAPRVNNGGGVWVCKAFGRVEWIQAADFFALPEEKRRKEDLPGMSREEIFAANARLIREQIPELDKLLSKWPVDFTKIQWVDFPLSATQDMNFQSRPQPEDCPGGAVRYEQLADFLYGDTLLISKPVWENPRISPTDQAAILLHEWIYKALREDRDEQTSARTRRIVALLFTGLQPGEIRKEIAYELIVSSHDQLDEELATFPVAPRCDAFVNDEIVGGWQSLAGRFGEKFSFSRDGIEFSVETSALDGVPEYMAVASGRGDWQMELDRAMGRAAYLRTKRISLRFTRGGPTPLQIVFVCWNQI